MGVAHANDRADKTDYVALSSTLLFVWALGAAIGPTTGTYAIQLISPSAFFGYVVALTAAFTVFALWRLNRRKLDRVVGGARGVSDVSADLAGDLFLAALSSEASAPAQTAAVPAGRECAVRGRYN